MIDWWGVFYNALWIAGLALALAALSLAHYQSRVDGIRLRHKLSEPGFQVAVNAGMTLFCLGLLFASERWWERAIWGLLAALFAAQAVWLGWQQARAARAARAELAAEVLASATAETPPTAGPAPAPRRGRGLGCGLILAGVLLLGGWAAVTGMGLLDHARSLQAHLHALEALAEGGAGNLDLASLEAAGDHLAGMRQDLEAIQAQVGPFMPLARLFRWVPRYGGDLAAAPDLLDLAVGLTVAGDRTFVALSPALDLLAGPGGRLAPTLDATEALLPVLVQAGPDLQGVRRQLADVTQTRARVDTASLSPRVAGLLARLDRYLPWFETAVDGALLAPELLAAGGSRTYLIVAQNNQEMRATGGFISGVGELPVENGRISRPTFGDSYAVDNLEVPHDPAPLALQQTMLAYLWFFRDVNWDADFPTSARQALAIYARDRGVSADGVISLDLVALRLLVDALGPIQVEGLDQPVTGKNVLQVIQAEWDKPQEGQEGWQGWWTHRKDFMGQIAGAAMDRLVTGEGVQPLALARALLQALEEKHILIYLADPQAASLLRQRNWDGAVAPFLPADTLLVVDSNVGFNKMDPNVARAIHYRVDLAAEAGPQATVTVTYQNRASRPQEACLQESRYGDSYADMMARCYWDYLRVYAPVGSELLAGPDPSLPAGSMLAHKEDAQPASAIDPVLDEDGRAVWAAFFDLEPLGERALTFEYRLPAGILERDDEGLVHYRLQVQKQPGTEAVPLEIEIALPPGAEWVRILPAGQDLPQGVFSVSTDLRTDRAFEVVYREGKGGP